MEETETQVEHEADAYFWAVMDCIRVEVRDAFGSHYVKLDIRDAVFLRYQLDGAINDYERAVGR